MCVRPYVLTALSTPCRLTLHCNVKAARSQNCHSGFGIRRFGTRNPSLFAAVCHSLFAIRYFRVFDKPSKRHWQVAHLTIDGLKLVCYTNGTMMLLDDDGQEINVPDRVHDVVRWLTTEAAQLLQNNDCTFKIVLNFGRGDAPIRAIVERHQQL